MITVIVVLALIAIASVCFGLYWHAKNYEERAEHMITSDLLKRRQEHDRARRKK